MSDRLEKLTIPTETIKLYGSGPADKLLSDLLVTLNLAIDRINELEALYDKLANRHVTLVTRFEGHRHVTLVARFEGHRHGDAHNGGMYGYTTPPIPGGDE